MTQDVAKEKGEELGVVWTEKPEVKGDRPRQERGGGKASPEAAEIRRSQ